MWHCDNMHAYHQHIGIGQQTKLRTNSTRSEVYSKTNSGPITEPCGTPYPSNTDIAMTLRTHKFIQDLPPSLTNIAGMTSWLVLCGILTWHHDLPSCPLWNPDMTSWLALCGILTWHHDLPSVESWHDIMTCPLWNPDMTSWRRPLWTSDFFFRLL